MTSTAGRKQGHCTDNVGFGDVSFFVSLTYMITTKLQPHYDLIYVHHTGKIRTIVFMIFDFYHQQAEPYFLKRKLKVLSKIFYLNLGKEIFVSNKLFHGPTNCALLSEHLLILFIYICHHGNAMFLKHFHPFSFFPSSYKYWGFIALQEHCHI